MGDGTCSHERRVKPVVFVLLVAPDPCQPSRPPLWSFIVARSIWIPQEGLVGPTLLPSAHPQALSPGSV